MKNKVVMTYFMFVLPRPHINDKEQLKKEEVGSIDFQAILKQKPLEQA